MNYAKAKAVLDSVVSSTDNQVELAIADVQYMRLCQRKSKNKEFYDYRERALKRLKRIGEEKGDLSDRMLKRFIYARSEFSIVCSTYYYYVGLTKPSRNALQDIDPSGEIHKDIPQYLNYLYQVGSGGIVEGKSRKAIAQTEFEYLFKCYLLAKKNNLVYWEANSLQSISEHLLLHDTHKWLMSNNPTAMNFLNEDAMPDSLLAGYLAQKSLDLFSSYGDIYQISGAYRTLAFCYWELGDYTSSLICLENALKDKNTIGQAPDLVASIREQLSLVYSAIGDKNSSDINRNKYLDLQEHTRQDRQLEARAGQLERTSFQLNVMIVFIVTLIVTVIILLFMLKFLIKRKKRHEHIDKLLLPLKTWEKANRKQVSEQEEKIDKLKEKLYLSNLHIEKNKRINLDNRAKVFLVNNVVPYIDRIINEIHKAETKKDTKKVCDERYSYITELTDTINKHNNVLTHWIQLQQGQLNLHIESFRLKDLFDILSKSETSFRLKGIDLKVVPSDSVVKADKTLTLFMLNTLSDNARKFTSKGGSVTVSAESFDGYVEISVKDTGKGLASEELSEIFNHKVYAGHGFGLMNCKGIIDKYRKISQIFNVCGLFAESELGKGSRFFFRLPRGVIRLFWAISLFFPCTSISANDVIGFAPYTSENVTSDFIEKAGLFADSAYYSNINGTFLKTLIYADSARINLNRHYKKNHPNGKHLMLREDNGSGSYAELFWFRDKVKTDYNIILDIRNEAAVAALALHKWALYRYNNSIYTQLFKAKSADNGLVEYCKTMQHSRANKTIAVVVLIVLLIIIIAIYYFLYYRHILNFRFCVENVNSINEILLSDVDDKLKLKQIKDFDVSKYPDVLKDVISKIEVALQRSIELNDEQNLSLELIEDEHHRAIYENEKLYISNSVIDNCLSTLKHETMYYPSRIRQLLSETDKDITAIKEVVSYYKELYSILCEHVMRQMQFSAFECKPVPLNKTFENADLVLGDKSLIGYLFEIVEKQFGGALKNANIRQKNDKYLVIEIDCAKLHLKEEQCQNIFTPSVDNIPFLICRQIVRELSELSNRHGCGIVATPLSSGSTALCITLARFTQSVRV